MRRSVEPVDLSQTWTSLDLRAAAKTKERRAKSRRVLKAEDITLPHRTQLEALSVGPQTRVAYARSLMLLASWILGLSSTPTTPDPLLDWPTAILAVVEHSHCIDTMDDALVSFLDACFWAGEHGAMGKRIMSALGWALPQFSRWGEARLPRTRQGSLAAERRSRPPVRLPLPRPIMCAIIMTMCFLCRAQGLAFDLPLSIWIGVHCYLRPGEICRMRWQYLVPGLGADACRASLVLHPAELSRSSKTGEFDEAVIIDDEGIVEAIRYAKLRRRHGPVVDVPQRLWQLFNEASSLLLLEKQLGHAVVPYLIRHSGAAGDAWNQLRSPEQIQARGRWKSATSVRRYAKGGRVVHQMSLCSAPLQTYALRCVSLLKGVFCGRSLPLKPPRESSDL